MSVLDNTLMYRLPYTKNDNPNGWIEITTQCNMKCAGCYKGIDRDDSIAKHISFDEVKNTIIELKRIRNCGIITITGGEALMHPDIEEIVKFIKSLKLKSFIHTNGILINQDISKKLSKAGLTGFIVRIDINNRPEAENEQNLHSLRSQIAEIVNNSGNLQLGFTCVVTKENLFQIDKVMEWFQQNHKYADYLVLILKREYEFSKNEKISQNSEVSVFELTDCLAKKFKGMTFPSYLGSMYENVGYKWVQTAWISFARKVLEYTTPKMVEISTVMNHLKFGNYCYVVGKKRNYLPIIQMFAGFFIMKEMRKIFFKWLLQILKNPLNLFKRPNHQVVNIVNPPGKDSDYKDYCDGCPDAVLYNGKIVHSCTLESFINTDLI